MRKHIDLKIQAAIEPQTQEDIRTASSDLVLTEELSDRDELFRLLVDGVKDYAIFALDTAGRVAVWNAGAERLKGYTADEICGKHVSCLYVEEARASGKPDSELQIARQTGRFEEQGWRVRKNGSRFWAN